MISIIADVHVGNHQVHGGESELAGLNGRCLEHLEVLSQAAKRTLSEEDGRCLIVAGDLFDTAKPSPQILAHTLSVFHEADSILAERRRQTPYSSTMLARGPTTRLLLGNHDRQSGRLGDHAFGVARLTPSILPIEAPHAETLSLGGAVLISVPFQTGNAEAYLREVFEEFPPQQAGQEPFCLTVAHMGIYDDGMIARAPYDLTALDNAIHIDKLFALLEEFNVHAFFAGDWHAHKTWGRDGRFVAQIGALVPTGWDNSSTLESLQAHGADLYGSIYTVGYAGIEPLPGDETDFVQVHKLACGLEIQRRTLAGPRFLNIEDPAELDSFRPLKDHLLYVRSSGSPETLHDRLEALSVRSSRLRAWNARADGSALRAKAREAVSAVRATSTLDGALDTFVSKIVAPVAFTENEPVFRRTVLNACREHLGL